MKLYEFEGKRLLELAGIDIPRGTVVRSVEEASGLVRQYGGAMAKAQVLGGRRAKQRGVVACKTEEQLAAAVGSLLGRKMFDETIQQVLVEQKLDVIQEVYLAVTYKGASPAVILSGCGGVDVEKRLPRIAGKCFGRADQHPSRSRTP